MEKEIKVTPQYFDYVYGADYDAIIQPGGRYSGKSYNSEIEEAANLASKESYKLLIIQDLDKGGSDGYYAGLVDKIEQFEQTQAYNITTSSTKITNKYNGNQVLFRGYKTDQQKKDVKNIDQVTKIVVEEGEWMTFNDFLALIQQLRGKIKEDRRLDILMNTVNEHCFVNTEIIQGTPDKVLEYFPGTKRPKIFEKNFVTEYEIDGKTQVSTIRTLVVLSTHFDNPYLTPQQRAAIEVLKVTDPELYKQLGEARFIKPGGAFFREFDKDVHVIEPIELPPTWTRYRAIDYGLDMLAVLWFAVSPHNQVYVYKELHEEGLIISEAAKRILEVNGNDNIKYTYAPSDLNARNKTSGVTIKETFKKYGVIFSDTSNRRAQGSLAIKEAIKVFDSKDIFSGDDIKDSNMKIFNNCTNLISFMSQILTDEKDANCYAEKPHDLTHIIDALRYYCVTRYNLYIKKEKPMKETVVDDYIDEVMKW